ncbi:MULTISPECIES: DUF4278 domain-containing protein [Cyanophyceae]|uniref:DUF4278 domain-containing protein n=1 Tax=Cyanophyceae TaxID=3028117 RepID=UPI0016834C93|nr:DUF4278 domain-containing protein [Trichocoleus sp. FACHB-40]MBD2001677.1 DUF4278 domain-containing protein [Trichocoleus sp. FACHB-40]
MKLQYRGNSYEYNPQSIETVKSEINAKFRGTDYKIKHPVNLTVPHSIVNLKFRGFAYIKGKNSGDLLSREPKGSSINDIEHAC